MGTSYQKLKKSYQDAEDRANYAISQIHKAKERAGLLGSGVRADDILMGDEEAISYPHELLAKELEGIITDMRYIAPNK